MKCWFFMSYARADNQYRDAELIRSFYDNLREEVAARIQDQSGPIAYFDQENLQPGDPWPNEIAEALGNCRTFLAIMSAGYFTREYCGKEWMIFENRCRSIGGPTLPPLIIPILWIPPEEGELPGYATDLQMTFDPNVVLDDERNLLADYGNQGLLYIMKRKETTHKNIYEAILEQLAKRIIQVAMEHVLPTSLGNALPALKTVANRFAETPQVPQGIIAASSRANFAFVAGRLTEMNGFRQDPDRYYGQGEVEWMPYAPNEREPVGLIAQSVATEKKLIANWMSIGPDFLSLLKQAEQENSVTIMIVDPWTARHPDFRPILEEFDRFQFRNCVVLIPWNKFDPQTKTELHDLLETLRQVLSRNFDGRKEVYFRPMIEEHGTLCSEIARALSDLEALLAPYREPARSIGQSDHSERPQIDASGANS